MRVEDSAARVGRSEHRAIPFGAQSGLRLLDWFIPARLGIQGPATRRQARVAVGGAAMGTGALLAVALVPEPGWIPITAAATAVPFFLLPFVLKLTGSLTVVAHAFAFLQASFGVALLALSGGGIPWAFCWVGSVPLTACLLGGTRTGVTWMLIAGAALSALAWAGPIAVAFPVPADPEAMLGTALRGALLLMILSGAIGLTYDFLKSRALGEVSEARDRADSLLQLTKQLEETMAERQQAQERLRASEERHRVIAEAATDAILTIDAESRIRFANPAAERIFGYRVSELLGQPITLLMPERLRAAHTAALAHYLETGERRIPWSGLELVALSKRGEEIPVEISFGQQSGRDQRSFTGIIRDISERKLYDERLRSAARTLEKGNRDLQRANRELEEFTSVASHDLQEPLRKLVSFTALLREDVGTELPAAAEQDLRFVTDSARHMQRLVQDLLVLSRTGASEMRLERLAVGDCVDRALEALEFRLEESQGKVTRDPLPELTADFTLLTLLYQNLISNALKFVAEPPPVVHLSAEQTESGWILGVRDNGIGIDAEYQQEIFQPFRRLHAPGAYEGTGIGLAICRKAMESLGGRIWVESEPGGGTHFRFLLGEE